MAGNIESRPLRDYNNCIPMQVTEKELGKMYTVIKNENQGFPGGAAVESLPANAGDTGSSPGLGRSHVPRSN